MVRATLKLASFQDLFHHDQTFENKTLFLKCPLKHDFIGLYKVPAVNNEEYPYMDAAQRQSIKETNKYWIDEINMHLANYSLYKLSESTNSMDFQFMLYLRPADDFDLFDSPIHQKPNIVCYLKLNSHDITGPINLNDVENVKEKMERGQIYIPTKKQLFQPYKKSAA